MTKADNNNNENNSNNNSNNDNNNYNNNNICSPMTFPPMGNSDHAVVSVSVDFPSNSQRDPPFHRIAYDYSRAGWDGLRDHLRDVTWEDISKLGASVAASEFCE